MFVATGDGNELPYVYRDGTLEPPVAPQPATRPAFGTETVALDAGPRLVREVADRLPGSRPVAVALVERPNEGLVWDVTVIGSKGGQLDVLYTPQGVMLGVVAVT